MRSWNARFPVVAALLAGTALFLPARARSPLAPRNSLAAFPVQFNNWVGSDVPIPAETLKTPAAGEVVRRQYENDQTDQPEVTLCLAYRPDDHSIFHHLPPNCLTASGWTTLESSTTTLQFQGERAFEANRHLIARGPERQLVVSWYWAHGRCVASEDWLNLYLIFDSLRLHRNDTALIRLNTPLRPGEQLRKAEERIVSFAALVNPRLDRYIPR